MNKANRKNLCKTTNCIIKITTSTWICIPKPLNCTAFHTIKYCWLMAVDKCIAKLLVVYSLWFAFYCCARSIRFSTNHSPFMPRYNVQTDFIFFAFIRQQITAQISSFHCFNGARKKIRTHTQTQKEQIMRIEVSSCWFFYSSWKLQLLFENNSFSLDLTTTLPPSVYLCRYQYRSERISAKALYIAAAAAACRSRAPWWPLIK